MKNCAICLERDPIRRYITKGPTLWKTNCCKLYTHYHCQVAWGNTCIICSKQLKCVSSTGFKYIPEFPMLSQREQEENRRAWEEIQRRRNQIYYVPLLESITYTIAEAMIEDSTDEEL